MATAKNNVASDFTPMGNGVEIAVEGGFAYVRIPLDRAKGTPSASGKMVLVGNTGGWGNVPNSDNLRINVMAGYKAS